MVEAINATSIKIPALAILKALLVTHKYVGDELNMDPDMAIKTSDLGYSNNEITLEWIQHFNKYSKPCQRAASRLLIFNGHGSHLTYEFITYCFNNDI
jgi:hypothetical protein